MRPLAASVRVLSLIALLELEACREHERASDQSGSGAAGGEGGSPESTYQNDSGGAATTAAALTSGGAGGADTPAPCPTFDPDAASAESLELLHPSGRYEIYVLGLAGDLVYFVEGEALRRIPIDGGMPETMGSFSGSWLRRAGTDELVWARPHATASGQQIVRAPLDDPEAASVVVEATPSVQHLVLDDSHVFWSTTDPHDVLRAPLAGGDPELLVGGGQPLGAVLHGGYYYWIDALSDHLERIPLAGGQREPLTRVTFGGPMAAGDGAIFWGDTVLSTIEKWAPDSGRVQLASAIDPLQLQVWEDTLYWSQGLLSGAVRSVAVDGDGDGPRDVLCRLRPRTSFHVTDAHFLVGGGSGLLRLSR